MGDNIIIMSGEEFRNEVTTSLMDIIIQKMKEMGDKAILDTAILAHEVNRHYCLSIGDHSQKPWDEAEQWQRDSAINGVRYHLANPNSKPEDSHVSWMKEKLETGWKLGPVKDPEKKEHPCMVPYDELPVEQRTKDYLFLAVVRTQELLVKELGEEYTGIQKVGG